MSEFLRLKAEREIINANIFKARRKENKVLVKKHKKWFRLLDVILILACLSNLGAYFITNTLVVRDTPNVEFTEANPVMAARDGFKTTPAANKMFIGLITQIFILGGLIMFVMWYRTHLINYKGLWFYSAGTLFYSAIILFDFLHDLSLFIGVGLW